MNFWRMLNATPINWNKKKKKNSYFVIILVTENLISLQKQNTLNKIKYFSRFF